MPQKFVQKENIANLSTIINPLKVTLEDFTLSSLVSKYNWQG
jgi:hypothetical protein